MDSVAVFCGSSEGNDPRMVEAAFGLGEVLASQQIQLVYGGAKVGLMGQVADGALSKNGKVIGVIPDFL
ncbi:MAG: LOG family protein, partial [Allomuricauda sp.]